VSEGLSRFDVSAAVGDLGWRLLLGTLQTAVSVTSIADGVQVVAVAVEAAGPLADPCLDLDLRSDRVTLTIRPPGAGTLTRQETDLAERVSTAIAHLRLNTVPAADGLPPRSVQVLELAIDALDIPAVRPFWKAVLAYVDHPDEHDDGAALVDPLRLGPAVWFQQLDRPRPQRNRLHLDVCVPHDEAQERLAAALAAGGVLVSKDRAPSFWVLADGEQNEVCITTWQGRD
jgi:4a-hydroxytetrahydrobiopterin dehydratase